MGLTAWCTYHRINKYLSTTLFWEIVEVTLEITLIRHFIHFFVKMKSSVDVLNPVRRGKNALTS